MLNKCLPIFLCLSFYLSAQTPFPEAGPVFNDAIIPRVDVFIAPADLDELLAEGNEFSNFEYPVTFIFSDGSVSDTLEEVGFRLRGNTSRLAEKKSFKLSFNTFVSGGKYHGLEKLNINGSHNDPTNARVKIALDIAAEAGVYAPRSNHVELYINDTNFGLYTNVEHIDEEFVDLRFGDNSGNLYKCLWPAQLNYLGGNPDNYKFESGGRRAYELKTNYYYDDYRDLAHFIDVLNNTPIADLPCELEKVFNVDTYLKAIAYEILIGHWDNYILNKNNFYLYHNLKTSQFEYIVFDVDNTLGVNWLAGNFDFTTRNIYDWATPGEPRPMYNRILEVPVYKDRLSYYFDQFMASTLHPDTLAPIADDLRLKIEPLMISDPFYPLDYGFTLADFNASFTESVGFWFIPDGIISFLEARYNSALQQVQVSPIAPSITAVSHNHPLAGEPIFITANLFDDNQVNQVNLNYQVNGNSLVTEAMFDDGMHEDAAANDGIYGVILPAVNEDAVINYYIEATDDNNAMSTSPLCDYHYLYIGSSSLALRINEVMPANTSFITDEAGEYDDWFELHNFGTDDIDLSGKFISDNPGIPTKWNMPDVCIKAGAYLLFWADKDLEQGNTHTNFKLSASGETLVLINSEENNFAQIDVVNYPVQDSDESYARLPNGTGPWSNLDPTPGYSNDPNSTKEMTEPLLQIHPNPTAELMLISLDHFNENLVLKIIDINGRLVYSENISASNSVFHEVNVSSFSKGVYMVEVSTEGGAGYSEKLVVN